MNNDENNTHAATNKTPESGVSRRQFLAGGAATIAALSLPANRSLRQLVHLAPAKNEPADDVITIALYLSQAQANKAKAYLADFTKQSGIGLNLIAIPANSWVEVFQDVSTRLAAGQVLDTAQIATEGMLLFASRGILEPLDSYIASDKVAIDAFYKDVDSHLLANFRQLDGPDGHTYYFPFGYNVMSMWINKPVFKEFNVPVPSPDWTWADFEKAATAIASAPNRYGFALITPVPGPFTDVYPWVLTAGGEIMNPTQTKCVANSSRAIEAATFFRGLIEKKLVNEPGGSYNQFAEAAAGKLGMFGGGIWPNSSLPLTPAQIQEQFTIVPWPRQSARGTPVGVGGFPMFKSSHAKAAVWELIKFSIGIEFQEAGAVAFGGGMPIRKSVANSASFLKKFPPGTNYFTEELAYSTMIVGVENAGAVENEISTVWEEIMSGGTTPSAGMKTMEDTCNSLMAQKV